MRRILTSLAAMLACGSVLAQPAPRTALSATSPSRGRTAGRRLASDALRRSMTAAAIRVAFAAALALAAAGGTTRAQPAPRTTLDVVLPAADGFVLDPYAPQGRLAIGNDGTHYVVLNQFAPGPQPSAPAREGRLEFLAVAPDGTIRQRRILPVRGKLGPSGFDLASLGLVTTLRGDAALFLSFRDDDAVPNVVRHGVTTLLRLDGDGTVRNEGRIGAPSAAIGRANPAAHYAIRTYVPTPDNDLLVAGGYGNGAYTWWMGKFTLDGARLWQAGPGKGFPEAVASAGRRRDGSWIALVAEANPDGRGAACFIHRYAAGGKLLERHRLSYPAIEAMTVLPTGSVFVSGAEGRPETNELVFVDDTGRFTRRTPWPFTRTARIIADGKGLAAAVRQIDGADVASFVVRTDARGTLRWRSAALDVGEIVRTPAGEIAALVWAGKGGTALHLMRFADP
jgi:hypothetical protein